MVLVLMDKIVDGEIHPYIDDLKRKCRELGFALIDDIIWYKSNSLPIGDYEKRPLRRYEHCLWFVKNVKTYKWNGDMIRQEYSEATIKRYSPGDMRTLHKRSGGQANQTWVGVKPNKKGAAGGNVIYGARFCGRDPGHPAKYPDYLPEWFIKTMTYVDDVVLDPFAGSGTTLMVAKQNGRKYVGYEIAQKYYDRAMQDLNMTWREYDMTEVV
jgi:DNA modification methylase